MQSQQNKKWKTEMNGIVENSDQRGNETNTEMKNNKEDIW